MKAVHWVSSTLDDLRAMPEQVRQEVGFTLWAAQNGDKAVNAVPMVGFGGAKVLEVVIDEQRGTYRAVYTVKFAKAIYVLHVFQKKSRRGVSTPQPDIRLIHTRLKIAEHHYKDNYDAAIRREGGSHERGA